MILPLVVFILFVMQYFYPNSVGRARWGHDWMWPNFPLPPPPPPAAAHRLASLVVLPHTTPPPHVSPLPPLRCRPQYYFLGIEGIKTVFTWSSANIHLGIVLGPRRPDSCRKTIYGTRNGKGIRLSDVYTRYLRVHVCLCVCVYVSLCLLHPCSEFALNYSIPLRLVLFNPPSRNSDYRSPSGISRTTKYIRTHSPYLNVILGALREIYRVPWPVTFPAGPVMFKVYLLTASVAWSFLYSLAIFCNINPNSW